MEEQKTELSNQSMKLPFVANCWAKYYRRPMKRPIHYFSKNVYETRFFCSSLQNAFLHIDLRRETQKKRGERRLQQVVGKEGLLFTLFLAGDEEELESL